MPFTTDVSAGDTPAAACHPAQGAWPTTRILFLLAGTITLLTTGLAVTVSPWFLVMTALVGVNQLVFVLVGACPASLVLGRAFGLRSSLYPKKELSR